MNSQDADINDNRISRQDLGREGSVLGCLKEKRCSNVKLNYLRRVLQILWYCEKVPEGALSRRPRDAQEFN